MLIGASRDSVTELVASSAGIGTLGPGSLNFRLSDRSNLRFHELSNDILAFAANLGTPYSNSPCSLRDAQNKAPRASRGERVGASGFHCCAASRRRRHGGT